MPSIKNAVLTDSYFVTSIWLSTACKKIRQTTYSAGQCGLELTDPVMLIQDINVVWQQSPSDSSRGLFFVQGAPSPVKKLLIFRNAGQAAILTGAPVALLSSPATLTR